MKICPGSGFLQQVVLSVSPCWGWRQSLLGPIPWTVLFEVTSATIMNNTSSRSHAVFILKAEQRGVRLVWGMDEWPSQLIGQPWENHRKTMGKWWLNGIWWELPSGNDCYIANWEKITTFNGQSTISTGSFSIAMLKYQRVLRITWFFFLGRTTLKII